MSTVYEYYEPVDLRHWAKRVIGWDAILPLAVSAGSVAIATLLQHQPPADILAMVGLPIVAFTIRLVVGSGQIQQNFCGPVMRVLQLVALLFALITLVFVDFFLALAAFVPKNGHVLEETTPFQIGAVSVYLLLTTFAMYPGRRVASIFDDHPGEARRFGTLGE